MKTIPIKIRQPDGSITVTEMGKEDYCAAVKSGKLVPESKRFFSVSMTGMDGEEVAVDFSEDELRKIMAEALIQGTNASWEIEGEPPPFRTDPAVTQAVANRIPLSLITTPSELPTHG